MNVRVGWFGGLVLGAISLPALATNGYIAHSWGAKGKAMVGAITAFPLDTLSAATNPASMSEIPTGLDLGVSFFNPERGYEASNDFGVGTYPGTNTPFPTGPYVTPGRYESDLDWFLIPDIGYNRVLNDRMTVGITIFGNGGMNTRYKDRAVWENFAPLPNQRVLVIDGQQLPQFDPSSGELQPIFDPGTVYVPGVGVIPAPPGPVDCASPEADPSACTTNGNPDGYLTATTPTGVNLEQLFIEFPFSYRLNERHTLGFAPVFAIQNFEAEGLQPFRAASVAPDKVTNNDRDWSYGFGFQIGWLGKMNDWLTLGASYRSRMWMTEFDEYEGLFADGGDFDIPAVLNLGLAVRPKPSLALTFDYQRIFYGDIDAIANSNNTDLSACFGASLKPDFCLGGNKGLGFGWETMDVFKAGMNWDVDPRWTVRGGVSYASDFAPGGEGLFNVLAPATVKWHIAAGVTYHYNQKNDFNFAVTFMPEEEIDGRNQNITGAQTGSLFMQQQDISVSWSRRF